MNLKNFLTNVVGRFTWSFRWERPAWMGKGLSTSKEGGRKVFHFFRSKPIRLLPLILVIALGGGFWVWVKTRPVPAKVNAWAEGPPLTPIAKERRPYPAIIRFGTSVAPLSQVGKLIPQGVTIRPSFAGRFVWNTQSEIRFEPEADWPVGEEFEIRLEKGIVASHITLAQDRFTIRTTPFAVQISQMEYYQDPVKPDVKKVVSTLRFNYPVDPESLEKNLEVKLDKKKISYQVLYSDFREEAYVHTQTITILDKPQDVTLTVLAGVRTALGGKPLADKLVRQKGIPSLLDFFKIDRVQATVVRAADRKPEHVMVVRTTDLVRPQDLAAGMEVYLLPVYHAKQKTAEERKNPFHWGNGRDQISVDLLKECPKVTLQSIPIERESEKSIQFKFAAEPKRFLFVRVIKGTKSFGGFELARDYTEVFQVPEFPRELQIMGEGSILTLSGEKKITLFGRDIQKVKVEIRQMFPDEINHFVSQSNGNLRNPQFYVNHAFSYRNIGRIIQEEIAFPHTQPGQVQYQSFDLGRWITPEKKGLFSVRFESIEDPQQIPVRANIEEEEYYDEGEGEFSERGYGRREMPSKLVTERLVLVTDLGVLYKVNLDRSRTVFVQRFSTGSPVAQAKVSVLGINGVPILSGRTDDSGRVDFPDLKDFKNEKEPTVYIVEQGEDLSFMPFQKGVTEQDLSRFDVGGAANAKTEGDLTVYLFSDRGIYRPGDEVRIGAILKAANWSRNLAGIPLKMVVTDPKGVEIKKSEMKVSDLGLEEFKFKTLEGSPTGEYRISSYLVKEKEKTSVFLGSTAVRVEEFLPDRMKIQVHFSTEKQKGWVDPKDLRATVQVENLFGTVAADRLVRAYVSLTPTFATFPGFEGYRFYDPLYDEKKKSYDEGLEEMHTDDHGEAAYELHLDRFERGNYFLTFKAEAFESEGGRGVFIAKSILVSPLAVVLGYKAEQDLSFLHLQSQAKVYLAGVNSDLQKTAVSGLRALLFEKKYVSVLTERRNGTFEYTSVLKEERLAEKPIQIDAAGSPLELPTTKPGDFYFQIVDAQGMTLLKIPFAVAGDANLTRSLEKNAELQIKLNKDDYNQGEEIELEIRAPYTGAGLITIEKDRVYRHVWFRTDRTNSLQRIRIPDELEGNGYVSVSFLRDVNSPEVFMSPLSFGLVPFSISKKTRTQNITVASADKVEPGKPFTMRYHVSRPGKIILFAIDEGILQVANYRNPDPIGFFLNKKRLDVRTYQILDLLLPELRLFLEKAHPGGGSETPSPSTNLNPFKRKNKPPIAFWSGVLDADPTDREVTYPIPDYFNGTLRIIAVSVSQTTIGAFSKKVTVQAPLVISPNIPLFVAPGDRFQVSAAVANNMESGPEKATVEMGLEISPHLKLVSQPKLNLEIARLREQTAIFDLEALDRLGAADLKFVARHGATDAKMQESLSVRPLSPYRTTFVSGSVAAGRSQDVANGRILYDEYRELKAEHAILPSGFLKSILQYLAHYPHGCTEQIVSQAFPYLILAEVKEFGIGRERAEKFFEKTLDILRSRLTFEGAFGSWSAFTGIDDWSSLWAMHYLIEAKDRGYSVPDAILEKNREYLKAWVSRERQNLWEIKAQTYGTYLLTRMGEVTTSYVNRLADQLEAMKPEHFHSSNEALFLASSYQMLKNETLAAKYLSKFKLSTPVVSDYKYYYDKAYRDALYFYLVHRHFPKEAALLSDQDYLALISLLGGRCNTFNGAHMFLALEAVFKQNIKLDVSKLLILVKKGDRFVSLPVEAGPYGNRADFLPEHPIVRFTNESSAPRTYFSVLTAGFDRTPLQAELKQQLEVTRLFLAGDHEIQDRVELGDEIDVEVRIRSVNASGYYAHVAVVDLLPGGFEPVIDSLRGLYHAKRSPDEDEEAPPEGVVRVGALPRWATHYVDVREDRVLFYGHVSSQAAAIRYKMKAVNRGNYQIPPLFAESMYDRDVVGQSVAGKKIQIEGGR